MSYLKYENINTIYLLKYFKCFSFYFQNKKLPNISQCEICRGIFNESKLILLSILKRLKKMKNTQKNEFLIIILIITTTGVEIRIRIRRRRRKNAKGCARIFVFNSIDVIYSSINLLLLFLYI